MMKRSICMCLVLGCLLWCEASAWGQASAAAPVGSWQAEEFVVVSRSPSPRVALALRRGGRGLEVAVEADPAPSGAAAGVTLGVGVDRQQVLTERNARVETVGERRRFVFAVDAATINDRPEDWSRLRVGLAVRWASGVRGVDGQRERFLHTDGRAAHAPLAEEMGHWQAFDLAEHEAVIADRRRRIVIRLQQPMDGKASVVINDAEGRRVRNLISGVAMDQGEQELVWDGLDDAGRPVQPGSYTWHSASHPGIRPQYLFSFANDGVPPWRTGSGTDMWGPDHSVFDEVVTLGEHVFLASPIAESGYAIVRLDLEGRKRMHYRPPSGTGIHRCRLAADQTYLYAVHDGFHWGQKFDRNAADWKQKQRITLTRFDIASGRIVPLKEKEQYVQLDEIEVGPGTANKDWQRQTLTGVALIGQKLYVGHRRDQAIWVIDVGSGERVGRLALAAPGALAAMGDELLAVSGDSVVRLDVATGKATELIPAGQVDPAGIAAGPDGRIYVSEAATSTVRVFDRSGQAVGQIGTPGGAYTGQWQAERMVRPQGLAVASNGWLWVTENREVPKRVVAWDLSTGRIACEKYGPTAYGAPGAGFDYQDHERWIGQGAAWHVDFEKQTARPVSVLGAPDAYHYRFVRQDGRTFVIAFGKATYILEALADGTLKPLALISSPHQYAYSQGWNPPQAFVNVYQRHVPKWSPPTHPPKGMGVLWVDVNGDGQLQEEEIEIAAVDRVGGSGWGHDFADLTLRIPAVVDGRGVLVTLAPDGYHPGGAPRYPSLTEACKTGVPIDLSNSEIETTVDRFGNLICNSSPQMKSFAPDGRLLWHYPNLWTNVHGSHNAPLPEVGVLQGVLFFLGVAPLDENSDVFIANGNHGRFFVMTSDGIYLDEMFKDVRMGLTVDAYMIGGECFGGMFGRSEKDGNYYLQSGHTDYRLFRIDGLHELKRQTGRIDVTAEQVLAAERALERKLAAEAPPREAKIPMAKAGAAPTVEGREANWPGEAVAMWNRSGQFPVTVHAAWDREHLYLRYDVADTSPWVNRGNDWQQLFKTGDSVDLQLGSDPAADPRRANPVPGDLRLLIAPFEDRNVAVLYRHRVPGATRPVTFTSPWRGETVDEVRIVESARISVQRRANGYVLRAAIPLRELGIEHVPTQPLRGDFGVIYGDPDGTMNMLRSYWSNQNTGLVNDVPGEIMLTPRLWGTVQLVQDGIEQ